MATDTERTRATYENLLPGSKSSRIPKSAWRNQLSNALYVDFPLVRQGMSEFLGTAVLLLLSNGVVAQSVLSRGTVNGPLAINIGCALAVVFGVAVSLQASGGHINPAMSLMFFSVGSINFTQLIVYSISQMIGAMFGSALAFAVYFDAVNDFDGGVRQITGINGTAGIFYPFPQEFLTAGGGLMDQIIGTGILSSCTLAVTDPSNIATPKHLVPIYVGLIVAIIGMGFGYNCGYPLNPARDLGPRIFTAMAGWGQGVFSFRNYNWFWVPVVGPLIGGVLGASLYKLVVGNHWPDRSYKHINLSIQEPDKN